MPRVLVPTLRLDGPSPRASRRRFGFAPSGSMDAAVADSIVDRVRMIMLPQEWNAD